MIRVTRAIEMQDHIGLETSCPDIVSIDSDKLQAFLEISDDRQAIHLLGTEEAVVIPANLLLALVPATLQSGLQVTDFRACFTAAYRKIRFFEPITTDQQMRLIFTIRSVRRIRQKTFVEMRLVLRDRRNSKTLAEFWQTDVYIDVDE